MAETIHYQTLNFDVFSDDSKPEAVICIRNKDTSQIVGRFFISSVEMATTMYNRAVASCDRCQLSHDTPPSSDVDWEGGWAGIGGLPTV